MSLIDMFRRINIHADLFEQMVKKLNLRDELSAVPRSPEVTRRAFSRCLTCAEPGACAEWLEETPVADEAPDYCRNHDMLERLKKLTPAEAVSA